MPVRKDKGREKVRTREAEEMNKQNKEGNKEHKGICKIN
jgi:hypothetical protein